MTVLTAIAAVLLYVLALASARCRPLGCRDRWFRRFWIGSCALLVVHVLVAFHRNHQWSLAAAIEHTRRETERVVGRSFGVELWTNFVFVGWWLVDACIRDYLPDQRLPRWYEGLVQCVWAFMFINATLIFGPAYWRWLCPLAIAVICVSGRFQCGDQET